MSRRLVAYLLCGEADDDLARAALQASGWQIHFSADLTPEVMEQIRCPEAGGDQLAWYVSDELPDLQPAEEP